MSIAWQRLAFLSAPAAMYMHVGLGLHHVRCGSLPHDYVLQATLGFVIWQHAELTRNASNPKCIYTVGRVTWESNAMQHYQNIRAHARLSSLLSALAKMPL